MRKRYRIIAAALVWALLLAGCSNQTGTGAVSPEAAASGATETANPEAANPGTTETANPGTTGAVEPGTAAPGESEAVASYGGTISVQDLKDEYLYDDSRDIMPLYNVEQTETFDFVFSFDAYDANVDLYDLVSVHTDAACHEDSSIYYTAALQVDGGKTTLTVSPMTPVLATDRQSADYVYEGIGLWGNAPSTIWPCTMTWRRIRPCRLRNLSSFLLR